MSDGWVGQVGSEEHLLAVTEQCDHALPLQSDFISFGFHLPKEVDATVQAVVLWICTRTGFFKKLKLSYGNLTLGVCKQFPKQYGLWM